MVKDEHDLGELLPVRSHVDLHVEKSPEGKLRGVLEIVLYGQLAYFFHALNIHHVFSAVKQGGKIFRKALFPGRGGGKSAQYGTDENGWIRMK